MNIIVLDITGLFGFILSMHVEIVPNRMALPAFLLRNKFRDDNKSKTSAPARLAGYSGDALELTPSGISHLAPRFMTVSNESGGWASIPPAYFAEPDGTDITNRLGRKTSSTDIGEGPGKNVRQRVLLVGQVAVEIMDPEILEFGIE